MKKYIMMSMIALMAISCDKPVEIDDKVSVTFSEQSVTVPYTGGTYSVDYTLTGGTDGIVPEVICESDWVVISGDAEDGTIVFEVAPNTVGQGRSAEIIIGYNGEELDPGFAIDQAAYDPAEGQFEINILSVTENTVTFDILPKDSEMTWYYNVAAKDVVDSYASDSTFVSGLIDEMEKEAQAGGKDLDEYLSGILTKGAVTSGVIESLEPESEMYLYSFGLSENGVCLTGLSKELFTTGSPAPELPFEINYTVNVTKVDIEIIPADDECWYVFDAMKTSDYITYEGEQDFKDTYQEVMDLVIGFSGKTPEEYVRTYCHSGRAFIEDREFDASTEYTGYVFEISLEGKLLSYAVTKEFVTGDVEMSDNTFDISVTDITYNSAFCHVNTSNDDPYIVGWSEAAGWLDMEPNEMRDSIISWGYTGYYISASGDHEFELAKILNPETEYMVFAFGYEGGVATTDMKQIFFTTEAEIVSDVVFEAVYDKYFDGDELLALHPDDFYGANGKAVLPLKATASPEDKVASFVYHIILGDYSDESAMSDAAVRSFLESQGRHEESASFYLDYDAVNTIIGVAKDYDGNYGKVYRKAITLTRDGVSPAEEY